MCSHMILRKPYAFLIKNFKKIHILLLVISLYVAYKLFDVASFVGDYIGIYDSFQNPITKHITIFLQLSLILLFIGSLALLLLLRYKGKPWKIYLIPVLEYIILVFVLNIVKSFFVGYTYDVETTDLRLSRDFLMIFIIGQVPAIGIFVMRVFGLDIKKFQFNMDQEFLELSEEDREEFEISINFDKNALLRLLRRTKRNLGYFYKEHRAICLTILGVFIVTVGFSMYKFIFVTNKTYKEGDFYNANGYTITINHSYFTDKDYKGDVITDDSNFVIVDLSIVNNSAPRKIKIENFHIKNANKDYTSTNQVYATEFKDLGDTYDSVKELARGEKANYIIVFKVNKGLKKNNFVLFYQEGSGVLRKIKLKIEDVSKIQNLKEYELEDNFSFTLKNKENIISFDNYEISKDYEYTYVKYGVETQKMLVKTYTAPANNSLLIIDFASNAFEGKEMVDFSRDYGKIVYIDSNNMEQYINFNYPLKETAQGKSIISLIPDEAANSESLKVVYTVRNKIYTIKIK